MVDHSMMDHSKMDHGNMSMMSTPGMDHSGMDDSGMDHSKMDHSGMDDMGGMYHSDMDAGSLVAMHMMVSMTAQSQTSLQYESIQSCSETAWLLSTALLVLFFTLIIYIKQLHILLLVL